MNIPTWESIDEPINVLGLLVAAFILFVMLMDDFAGNLTPVISLVLAFVAVVILIAVIKHRK